MSLLHESSPVGKKKNGSHKYAIACKLLYLLAFQQGTERFASVEGVVGTAVRCKGRYGEKASGTSPPRFLVGIDDACRAREREVLDGVHVQDPFNPGKLIW